METLIWFRPQIKLSWKDMVSQSILFVWKFICVLTCLFKTAERKDLHL